ncbi:hypothetical protein [Aquamicrobium sp. LC103]|uniref:hypothetical protein n=1 Tax=Aquamicrobium sp. LC103 TaxID=1120658 RepID=UPI00063E78BF|nr:hypothetical protein [Aquamicrobium sp. LC103]
MTRTVSISLPLKRLSATIRAVIFEVLEKKHLIRVLAIFFGGRDHQRRMLVRMLTISEVYDIAPLAC